MPQPNIGDRVFICPTSSNVLADGYTGRFLPLEGEAAVWTAHHAVRFRHGEIEVLHRELAPRELAPGEMLEAAPSPAGSAVVDGVTVLSGQVDHEHMSALAGLGGASLLSVKE